MSCAILLETGEPILLESGEVLLLEECPPGFFGGGEDVTIGPVENRGRHNRFVKQFIKRFLEAVDG